MRRHILFLVLALSTLCWNSCRHSRGIVKPTTPSESSPADIQPKAAASFAANFQCEMRNVSLNGMMRAKEDSVIWVSISKGVELGRLKMTPDSVCIYSRLTQQYYNGDYVTLYALSGYPVNFYEIQRILIDAYRNRKPTIELAAPSKRGHDTLQLHVIHYSTVREQSYPLTIPNRARPFHNE